MFPSTVPYRTVKKDLMHLFLESLLTGIVRIYTEVEEFVSYDFFRKYTI